MTSKIIGFAGFKGSGKTTIAEATGLPVISLADPLRDACQTIFALEDTHIYDRENKETPGPLGVSYREAAQKLGVWVRGEFGSDFWIRAAQARIDRLDVDAVVVDDVRFVNESEWVDVCVGIRRPTVWLDDEHISETTLLDNWSEMIDHVLVNDGTVEDAVHNLRERGILP